MALDLSWLIGLGMRSVEKKDFTWFFTLDEATIATESPWRLIRERVNVTSEDDGHPFGLPSPVNAAKVVMQMVGGGVVDRFILDERSRDLALIFDDNTTIQFVTLSGGYEGWLISHGDQLIICLGGGELAIFGPR